MKLYYSKGACSLSPHIALLEAGLPFELVKVDLKNKQTENGEDFLKINSKGYVPALELDNGTLLTEGPAILQYIADLKPNLHLAPPSSSQERYVLQEWLNFIASELHKPVASLFNQNMPDAWRHSVMELVTKRFNWVSSDLGEKAFIMNEYSVADCYLFTILRWTRYVGIKLTSWPTLITYMDRMQNRPWVKEALKAEGILK